MTRQHRTEYFNDPRRIALDGRYGDHKFRGVNLAIPETDHRSWSILVACRRFGIHQRDAFAGMQFRKRSLLCGEFIASSCSRKVF